jgi:hypothetical protein
MHTTDRARRLRQPTRSTVHVLFPPAGGPAIGERQRGGKSWAGFNDLFGREPNEIGCHRGDIESALENEGEWLRLQWLYGP